MRTEAIVIKKLDQGEHGELLHLYTREQGKVVAVAKGLKRKSSKQAAHLEPFNLIDCRLIAPRAHTGLPLIASAHSRASYPQIKTDLTKLALGFYLLELIDQLIYENEADVALWQWLVSQLVKLEQLDTSALVGVQREHYLIERRQELLNLLGYQRAVTLDGEAEYLWSDLVNRPARALQFARSLSANGVLE